MSSYNPFSLKAALELAAPRTWVAAIGPTVVAGALVIAMSLQPDSAQAGLDIKSLLIWLGMLVCAVLMQSAVNALNDYEDFKSGLDSVDTILDQSDASIVYNGINPRNALYFALLCLLAAAAFGLAVVLNTNYLVLVLGLVAAVIVVLYSNGPKPISSLPLGELISGLAMGGLITVATVYAVALSFGSLAVAAAIVPFAAIAQIMLTNNTCDIKRDTIAGRRTLPVLIGHQRSALLNAALGWFCQAWMIGLLVAQGWYLGLIVVVLGIFLSIRYLAVLRSGSYDLINRGKMMGCVTAFNLLIMIIWVVALLVGGAGYAYFA